MKKFILFVIVAVVGLFLIDSIFFSGDKDSKTSSTQDEWYAGGTLHKATISEWKVATSKNKLATCADFVAHKNEDISLDMMKIKASALKTCIDEAVNGHSAVDNEAVSQIAAQCILLMDK